MKRVVIAGLGTVGGGVYTILTQQKERLARELGGEIRVEAVLVRDRAKCRNSDIPAELLTDDPDILLSSGADALLEATGDTALGYKLARVAMDRGMHVITAGKALVSGQVGGNAREVLAAAGIAMYTYRAGGSVRDAFDRFSKNTLEQSA